jgi:hypothetical protein
MGTALVSKSMSLPVSVNNLDAYIRHVNAIPMLSADEEHSLALRFGENKDLEAAWALVMAHLRFVVSVARGYMGYGLPLGDLVQEGNVGLMKAVKRFDPDRGVRLYPSLYTGFVRRSTSLFFATGVSLKWRRPRPSASCFLTCVGPRNAWVGWDPTKWMVWPSSLMWMPQRLWRWSPD